jgi:hypothetical protein
MSKSLLQRLIDDLTLPLAFGIDRLARPNGGFVWKVTFNDVDEVLPEDFLDEEACHSWVLLAEGTDLHTTLRQASDRYETFLEEYPELISKNTVP